MNKNQVNTVLGPISADEMGITLMHEHIIFSHPGWEGDRTVAPFNYKEMVAAGVAVMKELKEFGVKTYVDATTNDNGRDVNVLKDVSEKSGVNIICTTGYTFEAGGTPRYWKFRNSMGYDVTNEIYEMFKKEITEGIQGTGIKAGVIKVATGHRKITEYEKWFLKAAAKAQKDLGVPIISHTQAGTMGPEQAEFLVNAGADPKQIAIGHMSDNLDINYQLCTLKNAGYVLWDRIGYQGVLGVPLDADRYIVIAEIIQRGYVDRIMLSHDAVLMWLGRPVEYPPEVKSLLVNYYPTHLFKNGFPAIKSKGVTDAQIKTIMEVNPRRLFAGK